MKLTPEEKVLACKLSHCRFPIGGNLKDFAATMVHAADMDEDISERQRWWLYFNVKRFGGQIGVYERAYAMCFLKEHPTMPAKVRSQKSKIKKEDNNGHAETNQDGPERSGGGERAEQCELFGEKQGREI